MTSLQKEQNKAKTTNTNEPESQLEIPSEIPTESAPEPAQARPSNDELVDDLLHRAGGVNLFHVLVYLAIGIGSNAIRAYFVHFIPFLIQKQVYACTYAPDAVLGLDETVCSRENICDGDPRIATWEIDYDDNRSLHNWQQQLDLMCEPDWKGGLLGSCLYLFWCLNLLIVPRQADKIGRRWLFTVSRCFETGLYLAVLLIQNYWAMVGIMVCLGLCAAGRVNVGTVYVTEWFPRKNHTALHMLFAGEVALGYVGFALYFWFIGNDTMNVSIFGYSLCVMSVLLTLAMPESPRLLVAKGRALDLQNAINRMAWVNRKTVVWTEEELRWIEDNAKVTKTNDDNAGLLKFVDVDVFAVNSPYVVELTDLPEDTDEVTFKRMLGRQLGGNSPKHFAAFSKVESSSKDVTKKNRRLHRQKSFKLSFKSECEMITCIQVLQQQQINATESFQFTVQPGQSDSVERPQTPESAPIGQLEEIIQDTPIISSSPERDEQQLADSNSCNGQSSEETNSQKASSSSSSDRGVVQLSPSKKLAEAPVQQSAHDEVRAFQQRYFARNLFLMTFVQVTCLFNFNLLNYLTNMFEQVYLTGVMSISSEIVSIFFAGFLLEKMGTKISLIVCFLVSAVGGILMLTYGLQQTETVAFPIIFLICRFGVSGINVLYVACNARIFDVEKSATAFGLGAFFARMILSGAPIVSTMSQPYPMILFTICMTLSAGVSCFVKVHPSVEKRRKPSQKQNIKSATVAPAPVNAVEAAASEEAK